MELQHPRPMILPRKQKVGVFNCSNYGKTSSALFFLCACGTEIIQKKIEHCSCVAHHDNLTIIRMIAAKWLLQCALASLRMRSQLWQRIFSLVTFFACPKKPTRNET